MNELMPLTDLWWDWEADRWDVSGLRLIADNDLTYHHAVEVTFSEVAWVAVADRFHHPIFRPPTAAEEQFARQAGGHGLQIFTWDAETSTGAVPMMVVARSVQVVEGSFPR
jgi:hypothetical protein